MTNSLLFMPPVNKPEDASCEEFILLNSILRQDFSSFISKAFSTINPGIEYEHNWHIELLADYLCAVECGKIKRLIINIPPRTLKSVCVSVAWPAWILGQDPTKRIMVASYAQSLSIKHSLDTRLIMSSDWYQELFQNTRLSKKHNLKSKFMTSCHGFRMATSVGGMSTGEGGDILIIDDPHNPSHINSPKRRQNVIDWFEQTFSSRLNNKKKGAIVIVMQRLHEEDLCGYLMKNAPENWHLLKLPVSTDESVSYQCGNNIYEYKSGSSLHNGRYDPEILSKIRDEMGRDNFAAQYMQSPIPLANSILTYEDISWYGNISRPADYIVQSWDTAIKTSAKSDYSVCTTWAVIGSEYYLLDIIRQKMAYPELKTKVRAIYEEFKAKIVLIEDKGSGQSIIQDLRAEGISCIVPIKPKLDKITRFASVVPLFQSGIVKIPKYMDSAALKELVSFPNSEHDDLVDSVSQFLGYMKLNKMGNIGARIRVI